MSKSQTRILLVSPKPPPNGGIGRWTVLLLSWLKQRKDIELRHVDISPHWRAVDDLGFIKRLAGGGLQGVRDAGRVLVQLVRFRPAVLHLTTSGSLAGFRDIVVLGVARCFGARTVYHVHMGRLPQLVGSSIWEWRLLHRAMRLADKVVVIEQPSELALKALLPAEKLLRLPNAIDIEGLGTEDRGQRTEGGGQGAEGGQQSGKQTAESTGGKAEILKSETLKSFRQEALDSGPVVHRVLYLGWVIPTKGMRELMEAWRGLKPAGWELAVAGPGNEAYRQELAGIAGDGDSVRFLGELSPAEAWREMWKADIFVLPTYTEGFPNVILEAMAARKAVVATNVGAIPEMLEADSARPCGLVIEPRDVPALVQALRRVMDDEPLRVALGGRARAKVARCYGTSAVFQRLVALWEELAVSKRSRLAVSRP